MRKSEFILKIKPLDNSYDDYIVMDYDISISAWDHIDGNMIDQHITGIYPELLDIGIQELCEGDMYCSYNEPFETLIEWKEALEEMGYRVELVGEDIGISTEEQIRSLNRRLENYIENEDYESAAKIRDEIKSLK